jgi:hypothetical protein
MRFKLAFYFGITIAPPGRGASDARAQPIQNTHG